MSSGTSAKAVFVGAAALAAALASQAPAFAAGYYNLGAFWRAPTSSSCTGGVPLATRVQSHTAGLASTASLTSAAFTETAGNTLVVAVFMEGASQTISIADGTGGGNTWQALTPEFNSHSVENTAKLFYANNIVGGSNTVTVSVPAATYLWFAVTEYSGLAATSPLDASGGVSTTTNTANMTAGTLSIPGTSAGDLIVALFVDANASGLPSPSSPYNTVATNSAAAYYATYADNLSATGTPVTATATDPTSDHDWVAASAAFRVNCIPYSTFTPSTLALTSTSPLGGSAAGGTSITVTGQQLDPGATVSVGGVACAVTGRGGTSSITCTTGAATTAGVSNIVVTDSDNNSGTLANAFVYGTLGTPEWIGGVAQGWGWQTYNASNAQSLGNPGGAAQDTEFGTPIKVIYGVTGSTGSIYVVDSFSSAYETFGDTQWSGGRIFNFLVNGAYVGWAGSVEQVPSGDPFGMGCTGTLPGTGTPGWCTGGTPMYGPYQTGNGQFQQPTGGTLDPTGSYLYVADSQDSRIVKYNAATGAFLGYIGYISASNGSDCTTLHSVPTGWCSPGNGSGATAPTGGGGGFSSPTDVAMDSAGTYLYVMDYGNARVEQFTAAGAYVGWAGDASTAPTACASSNPGCTLGGAASFTGGFVTGGVSTTNSGTITGGFKSGTANTTHNPGLAVDNVNSYLYVTDTGNSRVQRLSIPSGANPGWLGDVTTTGTNCTSTGFSNGWCGAGGKAGSNTGSVLGALNKPTGIATDGTYIYVADYGNNRVMRYSVAGTSPAWIGNSSNVFTGSWSTSATASTAATLSSPGSYDGGFNEPMSVAIDAADGYLYVSDLTYRVNRYTTAGAYVSSLSNLAAAPTGWMTGGQSAGGYGDGTFNSNTYDGWGIALDPTNSAIYVSDSAGGRILKYTMSGAYVGWVGAAGAIAPAGSPSCASTANNTAVPTWCTGSIPGNHPQTNGTFYNPEGLAVDPTGTYIYVADASDSRIERINTSDGSFAGFIADVTTAGTGCASSTGVTATWCSNATAYTLGPGSGYVDGAMNNPMGIAVDPSGFIYVSDNTNNRVLKYSSSGAFQGWIGYGTNSGGNSYCPGSTAAAATGWCSGGTTTVSSSYAAGGFDTPFWVVLDAQSPPNLWVIDWGKRAQKFNSSTGAYLGTVAMGGDYQYALGVDPAGTSLFSYENFDGGAADSFSRYIVSTASVFGYWGNLVVNSTLVNGQAGCSSQTVGSGSLTGMWCNSTENSFWGPSASVGIANTQIAIDSATQYMYWVDSVNNRIVRVPINN